MQRLQGFQAVDIFDVFRVVCTPLRSSFWLVFRHSPSFLKCNECPSCSWSSPLCWHWLPQLQSPRDLFSTNSHRLTINQYQYQYHHQKMSTTWNINPKHQNLKQPAMTVKAEGRRTSSRQATSNLLFRWGMDLCIQLVIFFLLMLNKYVM